MNRRRKTGPTNEPLLFGHRGAASERPENTLASFARALEVGADVLETDVHITADGHPVLSHDDTGARMAGVPAAIRDVTLSELEQWDAGWGFVAADGGRPFAGRGHRIPTLERALEAFPDAAFNVDIKDRRPRAARPLLAVLRRHGAHERVRLASFHAAAVMAVRRGGYTGETSLCREEVALALALPAPVFRRIPRTGSAAQLPQRVGGLNIGRRGVIDKLHRAGLRVDFWTINDPARAAELLALGADGLVTDDPGALRAAFDRAS